MLNADIEKFKPPVLDDKIIGRPVLMKKLDAVSKRNLFFIHAPAGYGKTTLVLLWASIRKFKTVWLSLDKYDGNIKTFRDELIAVMSAGSPTDGFNHDVRFDSSPVESLLYFLSHLDSSMVPDLIVMDNFDAETHDSITALLDSLKSRLPANARLVILSRNPPPVQLYGLVVKHELVVINFNDLRFTKAEIKDLFEVYGIRLSSAETCALYDNTGGWAALLVSLICCGESYHDAALNFSRYLISQIYDIWSDSEKYILLKTALADFIDPDFCKTVTKRKDSFDILMKLRHKTGFIIHKDNDTYEYHPVFRSFLLAEFAKDKTIRKDRIYGEAALWFSNRRKPLSAVDMAIKSGNTDILEKILFIVCDSQNYTVGVEDFAAIIETSLVKHIAFEIIKRTPILSMKYAWRHFLDGSLQEFDSWLEHIYDMLINGEMKRSSEIAAALMTLSLRCKSVWDILEIAERGVKYFESASKDIIRNVVSLTHNLPFFHKAQHDYSEISQCPHTYLQKAKPLLGPLFGAPYPLLEQLLIGGIMCERNELEIAYDVIIGLWRIKHEAPPEILFCTYILMCEILFLQNKRRFANDTLKETEKMIKSKGFDFLLPNFRAYKTKAELYQGEIKAAVDWLDNYSIDIDSDLKFHQSFQNLVTARALIVTGQLRSAMKFLDKLLKFSSDYNRTIDATEILTLRAVCRWRDDKKSASADLESALIIGCKRELINVIAWEGADITPILERVDNRMRMGLCGERLDKEFLLKVYLRSKEIAKISKGLLYALKEKGVKLSKMQLNVLKLLSQNLTYMQIAETTGIKITTVRDHISKLYEKLGVNNSKDALVRARELDLI